jgi:hypothetical protein
VPISNRLACARSAVAAWSFRSGPTGGGLSVRGTESSTAHSSTAHSSMREAVRSRGAIVACLIVLVSALAGVVWGFVAPAEHLVVVEQGGAVLLTGESNHRFDALAVFVCIGFALGFVTSILTWFVRELRGPRPTVLIVGSSIVGAIACAGAGLGVAALTHARPSDPAVGEIIPFAPGLSTPLALLAQPLAAAVMILVMAVLSSSDDLVATPTPVA